MEQSRDTTPMQELIQRYNRELMELYRQQQPTEDPAPAEDPLFDEQFPLPDLQRDKAVIEATLDAQAPTAVVDDAPPTFPYTDEDLKGQVPRAPETGSGPEEETPSHVGYLQVFVFTGNGAEPLEGARVTVTRSVEDTQLLLASAVTDRNGLTPSIPLPSVDPALTLQPGNIQPYIPYDVQVNAPGFSPTIYENIPIYGGNGVTQSAALTPLLPGENGDVPLVFRSGGPTEL